MRCKAKNVFSSIKIKMKYFINRLQVFYLYELSD